MLFRLKVEVGPNWVTVNGVRVMSSTYPKDMRRASVPGGELVFRPDLIRARLSELLGVRILPIRPGSSFYVLVERPLQVAYYDPHFIDCEEVDDFAKPESTKEGYREEYFISLEPHDIPVTCKEKG